MRSYSLPNERTFHMQVCTLWHCHHCTKPQCGTFILIISLHQQAVWISGGGFIHRWRLGKWPTPWNQNNCSPATKNRYFSLFSRSCFWKLKRCVINLHKKTRQGINKPPCAMLGVKYNQKLYDNVLLLVNLLFFRAYAVKNDKLTWPQLRLEKRQAVNLVSNHKIIWKNGTNFWIN